MDGTYFSEAFLCADGMDDHTITNASYHGQHVETDAHGDTGCQLNIAANHVRHIIQIFAI